MALLLHLQGISPGGDGGEGIGLAVGRRAGGTGEGVGKGRGCLALLCQRHGNTLAGIAVTLDRPAHGDALGHGGDGEVLEYEHTRIITRWDIRWKRPLTSLAVDRCPSFAEIEPADGVAECIMRVFDLQFFDGSVGVPGQGLNGQSGRENTVVCRGLGFALVQRNGDLRGVDQPHIELKGFLIGGERETPCYRPASVRGSVDRDRHTVAEDRFLGGVADDVDTVARLLTYKRAVIGLAALVPLQLRRDPGGSHLVSGCVDRSAVIRGSKNHLYGSIFICIEDRPYGDILFGHVEEVGAVRKFGDGQVLHGGIPALEGVPFGNVERQFNLLAHFYLRVARYRIAVHRGGAVFQPEFIRVRQFDGVGSRPAKDGRIVTAAFGVGHPHADP